MLSSFHDNEPSRNQGELHFQYWDWFKVNTDQLTPVQPVISYGLEETQNFFGQISSVAGEQNTKNRIRSVSLEVLTPAKTIQYDVDSVVTDCNLPLFLCATPVPSGAADQSSASNGESLIGQISTVVHPDVRQPWVRIGHWNWQSMFKDTQLTPLYTNYVTTQSDAIGIELFRLTIVDSVNGILLTSPADDNTVIDFRVCVELAAPIGLVPNPTRFRCNYALFAGINNPVINIGASPDDNKDNTPVQYKVLGLQNKM